MADDGGRRPPARRAAARTALAALAAALCIGARDVRSFTLGQLVDASDQRGPGDLNALLRSNGTWQVN